MSKRVAIIVTSNARLGNTGKVTGIWAEELAIPYYALRDAGVEVEIASPLGGEVPFEPSSLKAAGQNEATVERFLADPVAQGKVAATRMASELDIAEFDALFLPGGHGTMWDLPDNSGVTHAVETAFAAGKPIAAVCHGPAGLTTARRSDGESILAGKRVSGFTNDEENEAGLSEVVPFLLETRMRELGGHFEKAPNWQPFAVCDGKLITGQNPASSKLVADHLLGALGVSGKKN